GATGALGSTSTPPGFRTRRAKARVIPAVPGWTAPMAAPRPAPPAATTRPPPVDLVLLGVAVVAGSPSAPLVRVADAPTLAIAFWRNALALPVLSALAAWRGPGRPRGQAAAAPAAGAPDGGR